LIDCLHLGRPKVIGCWQLGNTLIDPGPASTVDTLLAGVEGEIGQILLTHIHLDHAGATGTLIERLGDIPVYVHERGAPHLVDPERLLRSAARLYGDRMDELWGTTVPVPERLVTTLSGGETLGGAIEVAYTPGHASHHVSYHYGDTAFVGDVGGVLIGNARFALPPTPPPDIDIEAWNASLDLVEGWAPARLCMTHFGAVADDVGDHIAQLRRRLDDWAALARRADEAQFVEAVVSEVRRETGDEADAYIQAAPPDQLYLGLERYWQTREG
jgi:glyoxylase-like metal-dependent hydrolase (beta-lactamase superfamily II)